MHFDNLDTGVIGQENANGIALDATAAGHGWFIDYTPTSTREFLPTSNPNEWVAAGLEAEGKMDMLTVLLHEYGHALGLDHTADAHDFMAATLQPGVRRTFTVDEQLELMRLAGIFVTPDSPSEPYAPPTPAHRFPSPASSPYRSARRAAGFDSQVPQFDTAANPKLTNSDFASADGWSTTGDVRFENGTATLAEGAATQTRLNQVFVVNEGDRFLSFTVANVASAIRPTALTTPSKSRCSTPTPGCRSGRHRPHEERCRAQPAGGRQRVQGFRHQLGRQR